VQSSILTGTTPAHHGIVGNGWFDRTQNEVQFWKQSSALVGGERIWDLARKRDPSVTTANLFWWNAMYSTADITVTPRPIYCADGRKLPDVWTNPSNWRDELRSEIGDFPLFHFWGPAADIRSTEWIARATMMTVAKFDPTLTLVYLPHLDYALQKFGPADPRIRRELREIDGVFAALLKFFDDRGIRVSVISEYGISPVAGAVHLNRVLRDAGFLTLRNELGREMLDAGASRAFAVCDHQVAHIYVAHERDRSEVQRILQATAGVEMVLDAQGKHAAGLDHPRAGDLVAISTADRWFAYPWWNDDARAPDFARTVDIHRKPGYDPCELFLDPKIRFAKGRIAWRLFQRKLGMRALLDVIPLDASLVRGSHGRVEMAHARRPLMMVDDGDNDDLEVRACDVMPFLMRQIFGRDG
jgi:predicted AlkP superfamily pyrophosphatase or phosphodiesterase